MLPDQEVQITVDSLQGLATVEGSNEYANQLLLQFEYYHPKGNILEVKPRQVLVTDVYYGVHPLHTGERADFYFVGEDTQYTDRPMEERERYFPFWRVGLYGSPRKQLPIFLPVEKMDV